MRAGGKNNKAPEINTASFLPHSLQHGRWRHWKEGVFNNSEKFFWKKKKGLSFWEMLPHLHEKRPVNVELGAVYGPLGGQVKPFHTPFQFSSTVEDCRTKHGTEDLLKTCVLAGKRMDNSSSKLTEAVCYLTSVISCIFHNTKRFLIQRFAFGERPAIFFEQDYQKKTGQTIHTRQSLFPPLLFFLRTVPLCKSSGAENVVRLRIARWPTWVGSSSGSSKGDGTG